MSEPRVGVLAPLRHRDYRLLVIGNLVSLAGDGFFRVAIAIQVLAIDNQASAIATVMFTWALGQVLALPLGGWASDRFERRRVMIIADIWRGVAIGLLGLLSVTGNLQLWHLLVIGLCFGFGSGFFNPSAIALVPDLLPEKELHRANAFLGMARPTMVYVLGPLLGGIVVTAGGPGVAFLADAGTFAISVAMLALLRRRPIADEAAGGGWRETVHQIGDGLRYVRNTRWALGWVLASGIGTLAFFGPFEVLVPYLLYNDFGLDERTVGRTMSYIFTAGGLGSIAAAIVLGQRDLPRRFMTVMYIGEIVGVSMLLLLGAMQAGWHAIVAGGAAFTVFAVSEIIWLTTMQRFVPRKMLGRVASLDWFTSVSLVPLGLGVAGLLDAVAGARGALVVAGLLGIVSLVGLMLVPGCREPENEPAPEPTPAPGTTG